jgi:DNA-binding transcriptional regulator GbsR (MarR family)
LALDIVLVSAVSVLTELQDGCRLDAVRITDEDSFIEEAARVFGAGMPPMAGRMWAYLAICEPPEQTAAEIAQRLHASRGSVSGMARLLEQIGLIRRRTRPGDRREYFDIPPDALHRLMEVAVVRLRQNRQMAEAGLALIAERPPESQARLRDIRDLYAFFEREWPDILARMDETETLTDAASERIGERKEVTA